MALNPTQKPLILRFGGGLNTRSSPTQVKPGEAIAGKNFDMDFENSQFGKRKGVAAVASVPNALEIRGFAQLEKADKTRSFLVQGGNTVYEWDGTSGSGGMTAVHLINSGARIRGQIEANSTSDDKVYIADLAQVLPVQEWDGTTFQALSHNLSGDFFARYIVVENERAFYGNIKATTVTGHLLVASARDAPATITVTNRPSSSLGVGDAFFLPMPNLRPINGLVSAFGKVVSGTQGSNFFELLGTDAKDHSMSLFAVASSGNEGDEAIVFADNDVLFGRSGVIDSLGATEKFGDVETNDISRWIRPDVQNITSWTLEYSSRFKKLYAFPNTGGRVFVLHKSLLDDVANRIATGEFVANPEPRLSPWSVWETDSTFNFDITASMRMFRPTDGLEFVYLGTADGTLIQLEAETGGDPSSTDIVAERTSQTFTIPPGDVFEAKGWIRYKQGFSGTVTLTFEHGGEKVFDQSISVSLTAAARNAVFNSSTAFFNSDDYFNTSFGGRLSRTTFSSAGSSDQIQVKASITGSADFFIEEIGLQFLTNTP
tara:strand:+ start:1090 stop:2721 length:1632 start_codon:yes stop_codon:yes gene_type:complete